MAGGDVLEALGGVDLRLGPIGLTHGAGVDTLDEQALGVVARLTCLFQADQGIGAEGEAFLDAP